MIISELHKKYILDAKNAMIIAHFELLCESCTKRRLMNKCQVTASVRGTENAACFCGISHTLSTENRRDEGFAGEYSAVTFAYFGPILMEKDRII